MLTTRIRSVQSRQNSRVKELRAAFLHPGRAGEVVAIEGEHLLREALRSNIQFQTVFVVAGFEDLLTSLPLPDQVELLALPPEVFASAVSTESPQPIAALVCAPKFALEDVLGSGPPLIVVAAGLQDPGNLGTLVRSAEAFGATGLILLPGTTSLWNAKTLRASSGSAFRLPVVSCNVTGMQATLTSNGVRILAAVANHAAPSATFGDLRGPSAILIGNEGAGLPPELLALADERITIPCPGPTESLNAAVAGSVLLYEASRQRRLP
jgi:TrmH family RNA methyltransferase